MTPEIFAARRARVLAEMGERAVLVLPCAPTTIRNNDVEHEHRQDSDLYYLSGLDEPGSVVVLSTTHAEHRFVLFVRPRDPAREIWDGPRTGVDGAKSTFGADASFEIKELEGKLPDYLEDAERLYYLFGRDRSFDGHVFAALDAVRRKQRLRKAAPQQTIEPGAILHEHRLRKDAGELDVMRRASRITGEAHHAAMMLARPGRFEHEVEAEILRAFRRSGAERPAYGPIVGSGPNATILHHRKNDRHMQEGELLLIDAGVELAYYASDVTRTFPISGRFSEPQRAIYDVVLKAQQACIDAVRPGATLDAIHDLAVRTLTEGMIALGLVEGPLEDAITKDRYKAFYMHRTSHWLGMDVHDVGAYYQRGTCRPLEPGMVLTVEPGLYVGASAEVDPKWRGIGVRIEDDVLVTETGHENLTEHIAKDPVEIERILSAR